jgi:hypothetical protein
MVHFGIHQRQEKEWRQKQERFEAKYKMGTSWMGLVAQAKLSSPQEDYALLWLLAIFQPILLLLFLYQNNLTLSTITKLN